MNFIKFCAISLVCTPLLSTCEVIHIESMSQFNDKVLKSGKTAVVKVSAEWCGPCREAKKPFEKISNDPQFADVVFASVDADANKDIVEKYHVQGLPTFVYLDNGKLVESKAGFSEKEIRSNISRMKPTGAEAAVEKKTEEVAAAQVTEAQAPEQAAVKAEAAEEGASCAAGMQDNFLTRTFNSVIDFFSSIADTVRGWFR